MNTKQMEETERLLNEMIQKDSELAALYERLSDEDKKIYYPKVVASFFRTHKIFNDARANQLPAVAVRG